MSNEWIWTRDNFHIAPSVLRDTGLAESYRDTDHLGRIYSGVAPFQLHPHSRWFKEFRKIIGPEVKGHGFGFFRINRGSDLSATYVHNDAAVSRFSGILYLNPPGDCFGGTAFWQHRRTSMVHHPEQRHLDAFGMRDAQEFVDDGMDESKWDRLRLVDMRWNRLLLFRSALWHSRYPYFGWGKETSEARLILAFFFN